jgi:FtsP/CotA-like multicopper oxidase with cupredoxin domain
MSSRIVIVSLLLLTGIAAPAYPMIELRPLFAHPAPLATDECAGGVDRHFNVVALRVPISYNHWGDFDPEGRLFVLEEELPALLVQIGQNLVQAGLGTIEEFLADPTHPLGFEPLLGTGNVPRTAPFDVAPLAKPFIVRAHLGECVEFRLRNLLNEPVSLHIHGVRAVAGQGMDVGLDGDDLTPARGERTYRVGLPNLPGMEGAHFLHSHADSRYQTKHGLFGALVAEPVGSTWLTQDGYPSLSGDQAIIVRPGASDFREYVLVYHDEIELVDRALNPLPIVSPFGEYGPGTKGTNLRTEPFMRRLEHADQLFEAGQLDRGADKSQAYGSYTHGDPATFMPLAYVGDPSKWRLVNAGPGQTHVHHLHGGGDRWRFSPVAEDTQFDDGFMKVNPVIQSQSERVDVQSIGPGETFNAEIEGGAGGTQAGVGDFLYHCHIAEHYVGGMWAFWRVFDTLQPGLAELPDRAGGRPYAVTSVGLLGHTLPDGTVLTAANVGAWIESMLPPPGVAGTDDASVWDWTVVATPDGPLYQGEPETTIAWPNYKSATPGERPDLLFNPLNGRPAYPLLHPHFGKRPPFAPGHGPSPYLSTTVDARHPDGLCPSAAPARDYRIVASQVAVPYNSHGDVDPSGAIFMHAADRPAILAGTKPAKSLVIRANQGDCVNVTFSSALDDTDENHHHSKVNMHIHLVQFDVQASDGVISGLAFEQSVRPATLTGTSLAAASAVNATTLQVADGTQVRVGTFIGVGLTKDNVEIRKVTAVAGNVVTLDAALTKAHASGERVGSEFVRYQWYPDVNLGVVYWHDHVDGLNSWRHGLFASLIVEPAASSWRDPKTGAGVLDGHVIDVVGPNGNFREFVVQVQERGACVPGVGVCSEGAFLLPPNPERELASFNLRSEPFHERNATFPLRSDVKNATTSNTTQGDPATDLWRAYAGDPVMVRLIYTGQSSNRAVGTFGITGHRFALEWNLNGSRPQDVQSFGIASHHNLKLECGAGGCASLAGDYLYGMTQPELLRRGAWGVFRVHGTTQSDLLALPGFSPSPGTLPSGTVRHYDVTAMEATVVLNQAHLVVQPMKIFVPSSEAAAVASGALRPQPLVLRALPGETIEVNLTNDLDDRVSLHAGLVEATPTGGLGIPVGQNGDVTVAPGANRTYRWHADREVGAAHLMSYADPDDDALSGLYGALVIEPVGSSFSAATGPSAALTLAGGSTAKEHVLLYASTDADFESSVMPYLIDVRGHTTVNYRSESLNDRVGGVGTHSCQNDPETCTEPTLGGLQQSRVETRNPANPHALSSTAHGDPETPIVTATAGGRLVLRALGGAGDQLQVHVLDGHWWLRDPANGASNLVSAETLGPGEASNAWITVGGPGDYLWGTHRDAFLEAGAWGLLRVT